MNDKLDMQIRSLVMELVDAAPPAPSLHELEDMERIRASAGESPRRPEGSAKPHNRTRRVRRSGVLVACAAALVVAGVLVVGGGGGTPQARRLPLHSGTWRLADDVLSGTWNQYTDGPPRGSLTCPTISVCYVMSGHYKTPYAGAPLLGVSLYASSDGGQNWTPHPMPNGFAPTSQIACGSASNCAAGGTHSGQPVLAATNDGGETWALDPLPSRVGHLDTLSCPSTNFCAGLVANSKVLSKGHRRHLSLHHRRWHEVHRRASREWRFDAVAQLQFGPGLHGHRMEGRHRGARQLRCGRISSNHRRRCELVAWHHSGGPRRRRGLDAVVCRRTALLDDWVDRDPISEPAPMRWEILSGTARDDHADDKCAEPSRRGSCPGRVRCDSEGVPKGGRIASVRM